MIGSPEFQRMVEVDNDVKNEGKVFAEGLGKWSDKTAIFAALTRQHPKLVGNDEWAELMKPHLRPGRAIVYSAGNKDERYASLEKEGLGMRKFIKKVKLLGRSGFVSLCASHFQFRASLLVTNG